MVFFDLLILLIFSILLFIYKSNLLKLVLISFLYPIVVQWAFRAGLPFTGIMGMLAEKNFSDYINTAFYWSLLGFLVLYITLFPLRKKRFEFEVLKLSKGIRWIILIFITFIAIISYPKAFGFSTRENLLPGQWASFYIIGTAILILSSKKIINPINLLLSLLLIIVIVGGERVDSVIALPLVFLFNNGNIRCEKKLNLKLFLGGCLLFILAVFIGVHRIGGTLNGLILLKSLYEQATASDVVYVYLSSVAFKFEEGSNFEPLINWAFSLIPGHPFGGGGSPYNYTMILYNKWQNPGGGLFYSEGVLMFGLLGIIIYSFVYGHIIKLLFIRNKSKFFNIYLVIIMIMQLRFQWYGFIYIFKPLIFASIFIMFYYNMIYFTRNNLNVKNVKKSIIY